MANRRMFSKTITSSSKFLRMPATSRLLYYDIGMNADDDGYCEWYPVLQMNGMKEQDMQVLQGNGFIKIFDDNVLIINDWKENNQIRLDRYQPSKYLDKYKMTKSGLPDGNQVATQVRLGKDSIGKDTHMSAKADAFESFWLAYPKKEQKKKTQEIWQRKKLDSYLSVILEFINKASATDRWTKGFIKMPASFLNGECWNDDLSSYQDSIKSSGGVILK